MRRLIEYRHPGWKGKPYESDFQAQWGLIRRDQMFDASGFKTLAESAEAAGGAGYRYLIVANPSERYENRLYRMNGKHSARCVYQHLDIMKEAARTRREQYRTDLPARVRHLIRVHGGAEKTSLLMPYAEEFTARVSKGVCEATGLRLDLRQIDGPYAPSLARRDTSKPYTHANTMVVATIYARLRRDWSAEVVEDFCADLVKALSEKNARQGQPDVRTDLAIQSSDP